MGAAVEHLVLMADHTLNFVEVGDRGGRTLNPGDPDVLDIEIASTVTAARATARRCSDRLYAWMPLSTGRQLRLDSSGGLIPTLITL